MDMQMSRILESEPMRGGNDVQQPIAFVGDSVNVVSDTALTLMKVEGMRRYARRQVFVIVQCRISIIV